MKNFFLFSVLLLIIQIELIPLTLPLLALVLISHFSIQTIILLGLLIHLIFTILRLLLEWKIGTFDDF